MPTRQQVKTYAPDSYYHLYNRGVGKMTIFHDERDYRAFLNQLRLIFSPTQDLQSELQELEAAKSSPHPPPFLNKKINSLKRAINKSFRDKTHENVKLLSFCLLPNHFHLVVYQVVLNGIEKVMRRLGTACSMHYKNKYNWVGSVTQGRYSASRLFYDPKLQSMVAARYVERNALSVGFAQDSPGQSLYKRKVEQYPYSSFSYYFNQIKRGQKPPVWLDTTHLLNHFNEIKSRPNSPLEDLLANHEDFVDFVSSDAELSLEEVRLMHLASL